ncbi:acetate--CoA ligase family protein [Pseudaestuariivita atlantica]|uniref:acetate--CoA ligase family protein n=1 Tax=Pseudaestuariivita atlantica TaxID=1317121 RepID=UPI0009E299F3|nr:acetate--CoA ligase family protein [Pseudaestuariivita atlantica]
MSFSGFLDPHAIAIYGASERQNSPAAHVLRNLKGQGFPGQIFAINPKYQQIAGLPCYPSQVAGRLAADLAVIAIPPRFVPTALQDCEAVGTRSAIVISAGFEDDHGSASYTRLAATAKTAGIRFLGPNCLGLIRPSKRLNATFQPALPPTGGLALISQSGAICSGLSDMAETEGLGFSLMMSLGNSVDFGMGDALEMAVADTETKVILIYVEGVRDGARFRAALANACQRKPVIVLKAGRHADGAAAATTHTGALIGSDRVFSSVLADCGAVQVSTLGEMIETARLLNTAPNLFGDRLAIVTNGGGVGVLSADRLADRGLALAELPKTAIDTLNPVLSTNWSRRNPLDIVGDAGAQDYQVAIDACIESTAFDAVLVLLSPQSMTAPELVADTILSAKQRSSKPIMTCFVGGPSVASARAKLRRQGIADFTLPEHAVQAYAQTVQAMRAAQNSRSATLFEDKNTSITHRVLDAMSPLPSGMLSDTQSRQLISAAGIRCPVPSLAETADEAVRLFQDLDSAIVMKIASPDISHKSEVDGVRLNLQSEEDVVTAFHDMLLRVGNLRPDATLSGVTVEPMITLPDARELLIGVSQDPAFGPVLSFGAGGTLVELLDDVATATLPIGFEQAQRLVADTKIAKLLGPFRNWQPVNVDELAKLLLTVSDFARALPNLEEMDINPLIASPQGFCAVDARIRLSQPDLPLLPTDASELHQLGYNNQG